MATLAPCQIGYMRRRITAKIRGIYSQTRPPFFGNMPHPFTSTSTTRFRPRAQDDKRFAVNRLGQIRPVLLNKIKRVGHEQL
jgi:hypothetical protein